MVDGAVDAVVKDVPATLALLERALVRRVVASHEMNADSSRSHFVASFRVTRPSINASAIMRLVDLAGSERVAKTKATGGTLNEASTDQLVAVCPRECDCGIDVLDGDARAVPRFQADEAAPVHFRRQRQDRLVSLRLGVVLTRRRDRLDPTFRRARQRVRNAAKVNVDVDDDLLAARLELAALRAERDDAVRERDAAQLQAADKEALLVNERSEMTQLRDKIGAWSGPMRRGKRAKR